MRIFADLHLHSKYSRGTSKDMNIENLEKYARVKGLNLLGTADFTHPIWFKELKEKLEEDGTGILRTKSGFPFVLQTEVNNVFEKDGKRRAIHNLIFAPDFETVEQINDVLSKHGDLVQDGRPTLNLSCAEMVELLKSINHNIHVVPAHAWTPWFGVFGSKSGFNSLEDAFEDKAKEIFAIETGLSSDPAMNWRVSKLDRITLISNSDSHSFWPWRIGRECNVFELVQLTYDNLFKAIKTREGFLFTIEFHPEEGKYHYDGHRKCGVVMHPKQAIARNNLCPVCRKTLTVGVLHRVEELADREEGYKPDNAVDFVKLVPLAELIALHYNTTVNTRKVLSKYFEMVKAFGNEFNILLYVSKEELEKVVNDAKLVELILRNREQSIRVLPGYDGVYGKVVLEEFSDESEENNRKEKAKEIKKGQSSLFDF